MRGSVACAWMVAALSVAACGGDDGGGGGGADAGRRDAMTAADGGGGSDLGRPDGAAPADGGAGEDAGAPDGGPTPCIECAAPPPGCSFEGASCDSCGTLVCEDGGVVPCVECAAPPPGCNYVGSSCESCGTLVCDDAGIPGGTPCGPVTCPERMVCCNESCGICTPPGGACIDLFCEDAGMPPPGRACGARLGDTCAPTEFCDFDAAAMCGAADGTGVCQPRPEVCPDVFMPVCGCDGNDYGNACEAHAAGTDDARRGTCTTAADCRETGCPMGTNCQACRAVGGVRYVCLPDGAVC